MSEHSRYFSPSSMGRRIACPGSAYLEADIPSVSGPAAEYGTACHLLMERWFKTRLPPTTDMIGMQVIPGVICDERMIELCNTAAEAINKADINLDYALPEVKLSLDWAGVPDMFGTSDIVVDDLFGDLIVIDYKFGQVDVHPDSDQLKCYAVMATGGEFYAYESIRMIIVQPTGHPVLQEHRMDPGELLHWQEEVLRPAVDDINSGNAKRLPSPSACKYCKAVNICPEHTAQALAIAQVDFGGVITEPVINEAMVNAVYPQLAILEQWIGSVKEMAKEMAGRGELAGHKLVAGRSSRQWSDEEAAEELIHEHGFEPWERKILSPAKAEKLSKEIKEAIKALVVSTVGAPTIVPNSSPKKAIIHETAENDFKHLNMTTEN